MLDQRIHGGSDRTPCATPLLHDFSTNRNATGPAAHAMAAIARVDCAHYPDPHYRALRTLLARAHRVEPQRVLLAASASEAIARLTLAARLSGARQVRVPVHAFGDYAHAARALGLACAQRQPRPKMALSLLGLLGAEGDLGDVDWACEPASPLGTAESVWEEWRNIQKPAKNSAWRILDCAYAPLKLQNVENQPENELKNSLLDFQNMLSAEAQNQINDIWQIWSPNKALGLTGVRAAYIIAPQTASVDTLEQVQRLAASWVIGTHGEAMLQEWCSMEVQTWLQSSRKTLKHWIDYGHKICADLGWNVYPDYQANYFCVNIFGEKNLQSTEQNPIQVQRMAHFLNDLRETHGIRLRDAQSFHLNAGWLRLGALPENAWQKLKAATLEYRCRFGGFENI